MFVCVYVYVSPYSVCLYVCVCVISPYIVWVYVCVCGCVTTFAYFILYAVCVFVCDVYNYIGTRAVSYKLQLS